MNSRRRLAFVMLAAASLLVFGSPVLGAIGLLCIPMLTLGYKVLRKAPIGILQGANRCVLFVLFVLGNALFLHRWAGPSVSLIPLFGATVLGVLGYFATALAFGAIERRHLPYLVRSHPHRYVRDIKEVSSYKRDAAANYFLAELILAAPSVLIAFGLQDLVPQWVAAALAGAVFIGLAAYNFYIARRIRKHVDSGLYHERLKRAIFRLQPEVILHFGGRGVHSYQLAMWAEAAKALDKRVLVVVRRKCAVRVAQKIKMPVLFVHTERDAEYLMPSTARVGLFTGNNSNNLIFVRLPRMKSVFIGHGDSDKMASANNVSRMYHRVFVAGRAAIERYSKNKVGIPDAAFAIVGRPQLDRIEPPKPVDEKAFTVLYAPTWEGWSDDSNYSSLLVMKSQLEALLTAYPQAKVIFRPHPFTGNHLRAYLDAQNEIVRYLRDRGHEAYVGTSDILYDCFNRSDIMVSDISSVVSDYLASGKPILLSNPKGVDAKDFRSRFPVSEGAYLLKSDASDLVSQIGEALFQDPMRAHRQATAEHTLGVLGGRAQQAFNDAVNEIYQRSVEDFPMELDAIEAAWAEELVQDNWRRLASSARAVVADSGELLIDAPHGFIAPTCLERAGALEILKCGGSGTVSSEHIGTQPVVGDTFRIVSASYLRNTGQYVVKLECALAPLSKGSMRVRVAQAAPRVVTAPSQVHPDLA